MSYPVEISRDPYDAMIRSLDDSSYPPATWDDVYDNDGSGLVEVRKSLDTGNYDSDMMLLVWIIADAMLPDGFTATSASLRFTLESFADDDDRELLADWYDTLPILGNEWNSPPSGDALAGYDISSLAGSLDGDTITIPLDNADGVGNCRAGLKLWISGGAPSGDNYIRIYDFSEGIETPAELVIGGTVATPETPPCDPQEEQTDPNSYDQRREYEITYPEAASELAKSRGYPHIEYRAKLRRIGRVVRAI